MSAFWQAVGFLTRFPVPRSAQTLEGWEKSPRYYPAVGLLLGASVWAAYRVAEFGFGASASWVIAIVTVAYWIYATGALHLDGWMDLADGLGSQRGRERALEIMKDSRVGAMGVVAAIVLLLLKAAAVHQLIVSGGAAFLVVAPLAARALLLGAIRFFPYVQEKGLGNGLRDGATPAAVTIGFGLAAAAAWAFAGIAGVLAVIATALAAWLFGRSVTRKLGGFTGDVYGALVEGAETAALLALLVLMRHIG